MVWSLWFSRIWFVLVSLGFSPVWSFFMHLSYSKLLLTDSWILMISLSTEGNALIHSNESNSRVIFSLPSVDCSIDSKLFGKDCDQVFMIGVFWSVYPFKKRIHTNQNLQTNHINMKVPLVNMKILIWFGSPSLHDMEDAFSSNSIRISFLFETKFILNLMWESHYSCSRETCDRNRTRAINIW